MSADGTDPNVESHVLRFNRIDERESPLRVADMGLARYQRKRYAVVGRPDEQAGETTPLDDVRGFNLTYLKCGPGKGIGAHAHATPEVLIALSGTWSVRLGPAGERETIIDPWDIVAVPPDEMHEAVNIGDDEGWMITINAGHGGAKITWSPDLIAELHAAGIASPDSEQPGAPPAD